MSSPTTLPAKKDVALALLEGSTVFVHLDPREGEVRVPQWFRNQPQLVLQIGLNMPVPILDLNVDDEAVSCTLSFSRSPFFCFIPWKAVYALVGEDGRGMVWPDDVPPEVAAQAAAQMRPKEAEQRPHLRAVPDDAAPAESAKPAPKRRPAKKRTRKKAAPEAVQAVSEASVPAAASRVGQRAAEKPSSPAASESSGDKGKRKLPPYLRIVK